VIADFRYHEAVEYIHFNEAYLSQEPTPRKVLQAFTNELVFIYIRSHLKSNVRVRNQATAFRMFEKDVIMLYKK
jgi:hypothetical protein